MALENPPSNKMISSPAARKGFHFAATLEYVAEYIEAETLEEAEAIYHKIKRPVGGTAAPAQEPVSEPPQSTGAIDEEITK